MRLATYLDRERLTEIASDPRVSTWTKLDGYEHTFDPETYLTVPSFAVIGEEGCFLARHISRGRYLVHTCMLPEHRGVKALRAAREALRIAFLDTDCTELISLVPANVPQALWFAKAMGMRVAFERRQVWPSMGVKWDMTFVEMTLDDWIRTGACAEKGRWFHGKLGETHDQDPIHDSYVGAAVEMITHGRVSKGVAIYNRFAVFAMYQTIAVLSEQPLRIDIRSHVLRVEEGTFNVEACHA